MAPTHRLLARSTAAPTPAPAAVPDPAEPSSSSSSHAIAPAHIIIAAVTVTLILVASTFGCVMLRRRKLRERAHGGRITPDPTVKFRARSSPSTKHSRRRSSNRHSSHKHRDARNSERCNSEMSHTLWLENGLPIKEIGGSSSQSTDELTLSGHETTPPPEYDSAVEKAHLAAERF